MPGNSDTQVSAGASWLLALSPRDLPTKELVSDFILTPNHGVRTAACSELASRQQAGSPSLSAFVVGTQASDFTRCKEARADSGFH